MAFSFNELNLSGVEVRQSSMLQPGKYLCVVESAALRDTRQNGKQVEVVLKDTASEATIKTWINVHVPSSHDATRIGREQLKALLVHGGHPNPDKPGDVSSMSGLRVGVAVKADSYEKNGETKTGSAVHYFFAPSELGSQAGAVTKDNFQAPQATGGGMKLDDDIPF